MKIFLLERNVDTDDWECHFYPISVYTNRANALRAMLKERNDRFVEWLNYRAMFGKDRGAKIRPFESQGYRVKTMETSDSI